MTPDLNAARIYTDLGALTALRGQVQKDAPGATREVARQFESVFVEMMLKSMRQADTFGGMFENEQLRLYRDLFDHQIALDIAARGDLGFADLLTEQIAPQAEPPQGDMPTGFQPRHWLGLRREPFETVRQLETAERIARASGEAESAEPAEEPQPFNGRAITSPEEFVRALLPHAEEAGKKLGLSPDLLLAQAALETGWGQHMIRHRGGANSHNLFGIKAGSSWDGDRVRVRTLEYEDGIARRRMAPFRAYGSYAESFTDYVEFLQSRPRYARALETADDPSAYIRALQGAGYATDPRYADKVLDIMHNRIRPLKLAHAETSVTR